MGYGWIVSKPAGLQTTHNGALEYFPSSTKAETMAILTALITSGFNSNVTVYTDSQAAIDAFHKSANLTSISPRRYNKIQNNILWSLIHHVKKELHLSLHFVKVKAHSDDPYNDIADALAKTGRNNNYVTKVNHNLLPQQTVTLLWNNQIPLDRDVRRTIGTITNYKRIENHFHHTKMKSIEQATRQRLIHWESTSNWFNYNSYDSPTSEQHTKEVTWRIKLSTFSLPTLDVLNKHYPKLMLNRTTCLLCKNAEETNLHLWNYPVLLPVIQEYCDGKSLIS